MKSDHAKLVEKLTEMKHNGTLLEFLGKLKKAIMKVRASELDKILKGRNKAVIDLVKAYKKNPDAFGDRFSKKYGL